MRISKFISVVLAVMMLFSLVTVGFTGTSAASVEVAETGADMTGGEVLYLIPNDNWNIDGARFAIYVYGSGDAWASMTKVDGEDNLYQVTVPSGSWTNVIFCRMNPDNATNGWNTKWNQTGDLVYDGTNNCCKIDSGQWDCGENVTWSVYTPTATPTESPTEAPTAAPTDAPVVEPTEAPTDAPVVEPTEAPTDAPEVDPTEAETITVYAVNSANWDEMCAHLWNDSGDTTSWPGIAMTKTEETVNGFDVYTITFEATYTNIIFNNNDNGSQSANLVPADGQYYDIKSGEWYASAEDVPAVDATATDVYLAGGFNGWSTVSNEFKLNATGETVGYITLTLEAATAYEFKVVKVGTWMGNGGTITESITGWTFDSNNSANCTLITADAGEYVFAFDTATDALSVTYPVAVVDPTEAPTEAPTDAPVVEPTEAPTETPTEVPTEPAVAGYYLVGTINGENYWSVDSTSADRLFSENPENAGEYMLEYTLYEGDEIKVVYFDGTSITTWYADLADNYKIEADEAGDMVVYFRPDGNADWVYHYFTVLPKSVEPVKIEGYSLTLTDNIGVNFFLTLSDEVVADTTAKVVFTYANETVEVAVADGVYDESTGFYKFTCEVPAKDMATVISCKVVYSENESATFTQSVKGYAEVLLADATSSEELLDLVKAMLNYGAAAQACFGYNTENLANDTDHMSEGDKRIVPIDYTYNQYEISGEEAGVTYYGTSLSLKSEVAIKHYFIIDESVNVDALEYSAGLGNVTLAKNGNLYELKISDIPAHRITSDFYATLGGLNLKYGVGSYGYAAQQSDNQTLYDVINAMFAYGIYAEAYIYY